MQLLLSIAGIVCLVCRNCEQYWIYMACWEFQVSHVVIADMDSLLCGKLWSAVLSAVFI